MTTTSSQHETWVPTPGALPPVVILVSRDNDVRGIEIPESRVGAADFQQLRTAWQTLPEAHAALLELGYRADRYDPMPVYRRSGPVDPPTRMIYRLAAIDDLNPSHTFAVPFADLIIDQEVQSRAAINAEARERYAEAYRRGDKFPPLVVFRQRDGGPMILADGFTRAAAAQDAGLASHPIIVLKGDRRDAILYAASANLKHGAAPSADDRRHMARKLLLDPEWASWSNHEIARRSGYSHTSVGKLRAELVAQKLVPNPAPTPSGAGTQGETRTYTRNGRQQTMRIGGIGAKSPAPALTLTDAHIATLRAVSAAAAEHPEGRALLQPFRRDRIAEVSHLRAAGMLDEKRIAGAAFIYLTSRGEQALIAADRLQLLDDNDEGNPEADAEYAASDPAPDEHPARYVDADADPLHLEEYVTLREISRQLLAHRSDDCKAHWIGRDHTPRIHDLRRKGLIEQPDVLAYRITPAGRVALIAAAALHPLATPAGGVRVTALRPTGDLVAGVIVQRGDNDRWIVDLVTGQRTAFAPDHLFAAPETVGTPMMASADPAPDAPPTFRIGDRVAQKIHTRPIRFIYGTVRGIGADEPPESTPYMAGLVLVERDNDITLWLYPHNLTLVPADPAPDAPAASAPRTYAVGDRVQVTKSDGSTANGTVRQVGNDEPRAGLREERRDRYAVYLDSGSTHWYPATHLYPLPPAPDAPPADRPTFTAEQIVNARIGALRSRAVTEVRVITPAGLRFIYNANDLRWDADHGIAQMCQRFMRTGEWQEAEEWIDLDELAIAEFAQAENLDWQRPDGSIFRAADSIDTLKQPLTLPPTAQPDDDIDDGEWDDLDDSDDDDLDDDEPAELRGVVISPSARPAYAPPAAPKASYLTIADFSYAIDAHPTDEQIAALNKLESAAHDFLMLWRALGASGIRIAFTQPEEVTA